MLQIDIGCGPAKREGFVGVDIHPFPGVDVVMDISKEKWPWEDNSVDYVYCAHTLEHLDARARVYFFNELHRILKVGAKSQVITPHWSSSRAYGDPTHVWPPVSEYIFYYISTEWRMKEAPHTDHSILPWGYNCDFEASWGYTLRPDIQTRNQEFQAFAMANYKDACMDMVATLTKKG